MISIFVVASRRAPDGGPLPDLAECTVDGRRFVAEAASGSICELCRQLLDAGIADQPFEAVNTAAPTTVALRGPSIYAMARLRVREDEGRGVRYDLYVPAEHAPQAPPVSAGKPAAAPLAEDRA